MKSPFLQRKESILSKKDKSSKGDWDEKIAKFCNEINSSENYYTTSSCSGRIIIMIDSDKKQSNLFLEVYHNKIKLNELKNSLDKIVVKNKKLIKFKFEPFILHVACKTLDDAKEFLKKVQKAGCKKAGIISLEKNIIVELNGSEKTEFLIIENQKILVNDRFLELIVKRCNRNLEKSWDRIEKLRKSIK